MIHAYIWIFILCVVDFRVETLDRISENAIAL